jgi:hypothetical protein
MSQEGAENSNAGSGMTRPLLDYRLKTSMMNFTSSTIITTKSADSSASRFSLSNIVFASGQG